MKRDTILTANHFNSSFLSCEKDIEMILRKLFVESAPYSDILKRLLVINTKDCLENESQTVLEKLNQYGYKAVRCNGSEEAIDTIKEYLGIK